MNIKEKLIIGLFGVGVSFGILASDSMTPFTITAQITENCVMSYVDDIDFAALSGDSTPISIMGTGYFRCAGDTVLTKIYADNGLYFELGGVSSQRSLYNGTANYVSYLLGQNADCTTLWDKDDYILAVSGAPYIDSPFNFYFCMPTGVSSTPGGVYQDTVNAFILFTP